MDTIEAVKRLDDIRNVTDKLPLTDEVKAKVMFLLGQSIVASSRVLACSGEERIRNAVVLCNQSNQFYGLANKYDSSKRYEGLLPS